MKTKRLENLNYAASRAHVWTRCVPSEALARKSKNPFAGQDAEAALGVALHAAIHAALDDSVVLTPEQQATLDDTDDAQQIVDFCAEMTQLIASRFERPQVLLEQNFDVALKTCTITARPDCAIIDTTTEQLVVIDYKTGYAPVSANNSDQLKIYANAVARAKKLNIKTARGVIIQPRLRTVDYVGITIDPEFFDALEETIQKEQSLYRVGSHCKNCAALTTCKLFRETALAYFKPELKDGLRDRPEEWSKLVVLAKPAIKFFETILEEAKEFLEFGGQLDGVNLIHTAGRRTWLKDAAPDDVAAALGIKTEALFEQKMLSPAAVEKIITKAKRDELSRFVYQPQSLQLAIADSGFLSDSEKKAVVVKTGLSDLLSSGKTNNKKEKKDGKKRANKSKKK